MVRDAISNDSLALPDDFWIIAIGDNKSRKVEAEKLSKDKFFSVIHSWAYVAKDAHIGDGTVIMAGAVIEPNVRIGKHCIINTGATVSHDCVLEDYVHIAPGAHLCGGVRVGEGALVGVGVGVAPMAQIPAWHICKAARLDICPMPIK